MKYLSQILLCTKHPFRMPCLFNGSPIAGLASSLNAFLSLAVLYTKHPSSVYSKASPSEVLLYIKSPVSQALLIQWHPFRRSWVFKSIPFWGPALYKASISQAVLIHWHPFYRTWFLKCILCGDNTYSKAFLSHALLWRKHSFRTPFLFTVTLFSIQAFLSQANTKHPIIYPTYLLALLLRSLLIQKHSFRRLFFV